MHRLKSDGKINRTACLAAVLLCGAIALAGTCVRTVFLPGGSPITASADENSMELKWTKLAAEPGVTVDAAYLWPEEAEPRITSVYRDGNPITEKMVTLTEGSVYHFRGQAKDAVLYTQIYVGSPSGPEEEIDMAAVWYSLLPERVREAFADDGWTWQGGWEYTGRAYLDTENRRVMVKDNDPTAVLYGIGLYLDYKNGYSTSDVFLWDAEAFITAFGTSDSLFASALERYYTDSGELASTCPDISRFLDGMLAEQGYE